MEQATQPAIRVPLAGDELGFENQVYMAQMWDAQGGSLIEPNGPAALGTANVARNAVHVLNSAQYGAVTGRRDQRAAGGRLRRP